MNRREVAPLEDVKQRKIEQKNIPPESIQQRVEDILKKPGWIHGFEDVLAQGSIKLKEYFALNGADVQTLQKEVTEDILYAMQQSSTFGEFMRRIQDITYDEVSVLAIGEAIKQTLFNYKKTPQGIQHEDNAYTYGAQTYGMTPMLFSHVYNSLHTEGIPDEFYDKDRGVWRAEAGPFLASVLDQEVLNAFAERIMEGVQAQKNEQKNTTRQIFLERVARSSQELQSEEDRVRSSIEQIQQDIRDRNIMVEAYKKVVAELTILTAERHEFSSPIEITESFQIRSIRIEAFETSIRDIDNELNDYVQALEMRAMKAQEAYFMAMNAYHKENSRLVSFKKADLKKQLERADEERQLAERAVKEKMMDVRVVDILRRDRETREQYEDARNRLERILKPIDVPPRISMPNLGALVHEIRRVGMSREQKIKELYAQESALQERASRIQVEKKSIRDMFTQEIGIMDVDRDTQPIHHIAHTQATRRLESVE